MNPTPESQRRLIDSYCNGELAAAEFAEFERLLLGDAALRAELRQYLALDAALRHDAELVEGISTAWSGVVQGDIAQGGVAQSDYPQRGALSDPGSLSPSTLSSGAAPRSGAASAARMPWWGYAAVVAATLLVSLSAQALWRGGAAPAPATNSNPLARIVAVRDCEWDEGNRQHQPGDGLRAESVCLRAGEVEIAFDSGPSITLTGPAELRIHAESSATLRSGKLVFRNDRPNSTFDLRTPFSELVDLGTSYDVTLGEGFEEVRVLDGEVWRTSNDNTESSVLIDAGSGRRFGRALPPFGEEIAANDMAQATAIGPSHSPRTPPTKIRDAAGLRAWEAFGYDDGAYEPGAAPAGGGGWLGPWQWRARDAAGHLLDDAKLKIADGEVVGPGIFFLDRRLAQPIRLADDGVTWFSVRFCWDDSPAEKQDTLFVTLRSSDETAATGAAERFVTLLRRDRREIMVRFGGVTERRPVVMEHGRHYLLVGRIEASRNQADRVSLSLLPADSPMPTSPPDSWSLSSRPVESDGVLDVLAFHFQSASTIRLGAIRVAADWPTLVNPAVMKP